MYFSVCVSCLITTGPKGNGKSTSVKSRSVLKSSTAAGTAVSVVSGSESASTDPSSSVPRTRRVTSGMYSSFCMTLCINLYKYVLLLLFFLKHIITTWVDTHVAKWTTDYL